MDAAASAVEHNIRNIYGVCSPDVPIISIPKTQKSKVIKYTKLPDCELDANAPWHTLRYPLQPRQRCIATLQDVELNNKLLKPIFTSRIMSSSFTRRKIVTISEDDENDLHPKFSKDGRKRSTKQLLNKSAATDFKEEKTNNLKSTRTTSRLSSSRYTRDTPPCAKSNIVSNKKEVIMSKSNNYNKSSNHYQLHGTVDNGKPRKPKQKDLNVDSKSRLPNKCNSKSSVESKGDVCILNYNLRENSKIKYPPKKLVAKQKTKAPAKQNEDVSVFKNIMARHQPANVIHVPLEDKYQRVPRNDIMYNDILQPIIYEVNRVDCSTEIEKNFNCTEVNIRTEPPPALVDRDTDMEYFQHETLSDLEEKYNQNEQTYNQLLKDTFDSLDIPNVTLTKDKSESPKDEIVNVYSKSLPNLKVPSFSMTPSKMNNEKESSACKSSSYIIGRATLTYTTEQKINFHVVGAGSQDRTLCLSSTSPLAYPLSVVSVFKKEMQNSEHCDIITKDKERGESNDEYTNCLNELKSLNCSYVFNSHKLVKPSDIISTLKVSCELTNDYICEQFQRELNFIDSFFESLQYLESCSLTEKCLTDSHVENWINKSGYDVKNFLTKFENGALIDVTETMASKSLCLLNLLIRDEQRRAKNLLFVLKMREDALKDFTKSQILWLENKKKQDNTDIPTLKKKQRGALLKLQHECGEMQRMRKALLTLSEKRKVALMKTKKNIELKLISNVDVDQIILGKKKLKRNQSLDRNLAPLKCFDLSSSGCEESMTSRVKSYPGIVPSDILLDLSTVASAEKCVQTSDSVLGSLLIDKSSDAAAENFVVVDGGYLNIIFGNLSFPQIFSSGKQYEVNEEALKNIVNTANSLQKFNESEFVNKLAEDIKSRDLDRSSSPSTARSLVEEFDQYYKGFVQEDKSCSESDSDHVKVIDTNNRGTETALSIYHSASSSGDVVSNSTCFYDNAVETEIIVEKQAGPLPVPAGAADGDVQAIDITTCMDQKSTPSLTEVSDLSESRSSSIPSLNTISSTAQFEAEELRRQQVAIEREIKALEQQQCQLLVVREIPDKPPPPYTPPSEVRPQLPQMFQTDQPIETKIYAFINDGLEPDCEDPFDLFLKDYCDEAAAKSMCQKSDKPWDSCNLLPQKPVVEHDELVKRTSENLCDVLAGVQNAVVTGVGSRRADHIDDILFAEWRRCEPEWTALHVDEAVVKNQIFESIFQKILTETIGEYKKTVLKID